MKHLFKGLTALSLCCIAPASFAQSEGDAPHPGAAVYEEYCAACHDNSEVTRAPSMDALNQFDRTQVRAALVSGIMSAQGGMLSSAELEAVADYLGRAGPVETNWTGAMMCEADRAAPSLSATPTVTTFGFDLNNSRQRSECREFQQTPSNKLKKRHTTS